MRKMTSHPWTATHSSLWWCCNTVGRVSHACDAQNVFTLAARRDNKHMHRRPHWDTWRLEGKERRDSRSCTHPPQPTNFERRLPATPSNTLLLPLWWGCPDVIDGRDTSSHIAAARAVYTAVTMHSWSELNRRMAVRAASTKPLESRRDRISAARLAGAPVWSVGRVMSLWRQSADQ